MRRLRVHQCKVNKHYLSSAMTQGAERGSLLLADLRRPVAAINWFGWHTKVMRAANWSCQISRHSARSLFYSILLGTIAMLASRHKRKGKSRPLAPAVAASLKQALGAIDSQRALSQVASKFFSIALVCSHLNCAAASLEMTIMLTMTIIWRRPKMIHRVSLATSAASLVFYCIKFE